MEYMCFEENVETNLSLDIYCPMQIGYVLHILPSTFKKWNKKVQLFITY